MPPGVSVMNQSFQVSFLLFMLSILLQHYLSQVWIGLISGHVQYVFAKDFLG